MFLGPIRPPRFCSRRARVYQADASYSAPARVFFHPRRSDDPMSKTILAAVAILLVTTTAQAQTRTAVKACGTPIETHCGKVEAGGGSVRVCIKAHLKEFSPACQAAFTRVATAAK